MELSELRHKICSSYTGSHAELAEILKLVEDDESIFPFNEYEHLICRLLKTGNFTFAKYLEIRSEYLSQNPNLWIFEISAPRGFGEKFAQTYVCGKSKGIKKPSKAVDVNFSGEYDLLLDKIKIEVKASRVVESSSEEPLYIKALSKNTDKPFLINFQQLKPYLCDVFVWVAVFRDEIVIWIMNSSEVANHPLYSRGQHRGNKGNEGQLHVKHDNIHLFDDYVLGEADLDQRIRDAANRSGASG